MASPLPHGLTPAEVAFLCEMELVTVIPRQRLESLPLLTGPTPPLQPPHPTPLPLWLALLLQRQGRADILPPPWLSVASLTQILEDETDSPNFSSAPGLPPLRAVAPTTGGINFTDKIQFSPPFVSTSTSAANSLASSSNTAFSLPFHFLSIAHLLLTSPHASSTIPSSETVRRLLRDIRETRAAKLRGRVRELEGGKQVRTDGVGALEVCEGGRFIRGVVDGLRVVGASKEVGRREKEEREGNEGMGSEESDEDML